MIGFNRVLRKLPHNEFGQRWSVNATMTLTNSDGDVYLFRRRLLQTPAFAIYLHDILDGDEERAPHSHPFAFASLVVRGWYEEEVYHPTFEDRSDYWHGHYVKYIHGRLGEPTWNVRKRGRMHTFPRGNGQVHRIAEVGPKTRTLVFAGRRKDSWGFFDEEVGEIVYWRTYLEARDREPTGHRRVTS